MVGKKECSVVPTVLCVLIQCYSGSGRQLIGALNAASNVTGVLTDTDAFSALLHKYGALAFWDYAAAALYVNIDMNSTSKEGAYKDGVYFSMHKFIGGPESPGTHLGLVIEVHEASP